MVWFGRRGWDKDVVRKEWVGRRYGLGGEGDGDAFCMEGVSRTKIWFGRLVQMHVVQLNLLYSVN